MDYTSINVAAKEEQEIKRRKTFEYAVMAVASLVVLILVLVVTGVIDTTAGDVARTSKYSGTLVMDGAPGGAYSFTSNMTFVAQKTGKAVTLYCYSVGGSQNQQGFPVAYGLPQELHPVDIVYASVFGDDDQARVTVLVGVEGSGTILFRRSDRYDWSGTGLINIPNFVVSYLTA